MTSTARACSRHRCGGFTATHVIQTFARRWYVHAELGDDGAVLLYTKPEWDAQKDAAWTHRGGVLFFRGSDTAPATDGGSLITFEDCEWTQGDGWTVDGTPDDGARFVEDDPES